MNKSITEISILLRLHCLKISEQIVRCKIFTFPYEPRRFVPRFATVREPWRFETVVGDRAVRGAVCQETEPCGGWAVRGSPRHEPNRGGSVRSVRTAAVCGTVVNTSPNLGGLGALFLV